MKIEWNKVTWYSKLIAVIFFVMTFALAFYFGVEYEKAWRNQEVEVNVLPEFSSRNIVLSVGQEKNIEYFEIILNSVRDSRCAVDVVCVWAGEISASLSIIFGKEKITKDIASETPQQFGDYEVSMSEVSPAPMSGYPIAQKDYKITFHIEKKN